MSATCQPDTGPVEHSAAELSEAQIGGEIPAAMTECDGVFHLQMSLIRRSAEEICLLRIQSLMSTTERQECVRSVSARRSLAPYQDHS
jgi:hypothetical protein